MNLSRAFIIAILIKTWMNGSEHFDYVKQIILNLPEVAEFGVSAYSKSFRVGTDCIKLTTWMELGTPNSLNIFKWGDSHKSRSSTITAVAIILIWRIPWGRLQEKRVLLINNYIITFTQCSRNNTIKNTM